eukprot:Tamp_16576.p2 GENE.Tamp_16576~~Tamp_16576.p2  ORF type:complete len:237 (+),score=25.14 Tamp_16576:36-713(+)
MGKGMRSTNPLKRGQAPSAALEDGSQWLGTRAHTSRARAGGPASPVPRPAKRARTSGAACAAHKREEDQGTPASSGLAASPPAAGASAKWRERGARDLPPAAASAREACRARASPALGCGSPEAGFSPQQALSQAPTPRTRHASSAATPERRSHHSVSFDDAPPTERLRGFAAPRRPVAPHDDGVLYWGTLAGQHAHARAGAQHGARRPVRGRKSLARSARFTRF